MDEHELRRHLRARAASYGPADRLRADIRQRLETLETTTNGPLIAEGVSSRRPSSALLVAATVGCVVLAIGGLLLLTQNGAPDRLTTDITSSATILEETGTTTAGPSSDLMSFVGTRTTPQVRFDLPDDPAVTLVSESNDAIAFRIDTPVSGDGRLVVVVPPADEVTSVEESIGWLESSLSQTSLVAIEDLVVSGEATTRVQLTSDAGMTLTGFRFGPQTFISASGVDRRYEAWVTARDDGGVLVVWVDTSDDDAAVAPTVAEIVLAGRETGR